MVGVLPRCSREDQIRLWIDVGKDIHSHPLAGNESMFLCWIDREGSSNYNALGEKTLS
jgi:hypothetical protein